MPRARTPLQRAAGKLISAVQKEWHDELGEPGAAVSEQAMYNAAELLRLEDRESIAEFLGSRSVADHIGTTWVKAHPRVLAEIRDFEAVLSEAPKSME